MVQKLNVRTLRIFIFTSLFCLISYSANSKILDTPEHRLAIEIVSNTNIYKKIISALDIQLTASCFDIAVKTIASEMTGNDYSSEEKFGAAILLEIVSYAYGYYGEEALKPYIRYYEEKPEFSIFKARTYECHNIVQQIIN